jgi:asparagine synthase (glutamine-hydrolysing)
MCGIAGVITYKTNQADLKPFVKKMIDRIAHRGPDGEGVWLSENNQVCFGHRRLSIIDLSTKASQPMISSDGRYVITYNGEIYNYLYLKDLCEKKGSTFISTSDTEVVLECFRHFGPAAFEKFRGMWALAIYDNLERVTILSRDPFAIKPLYYGFSNDLLFFASEPKALIAGHKVFKDVDDVTVKLFLEYGYLDRHNWTFFRNIKRFPHAHYAVIKQEKTITLNFCPYWMPPKQIQKIQMADAAEHLKLLLNDSIKIHMRSDVPVGACLSGGIDSSAIACIAAKFSHDQQLSTFTTHYPSFPNIDETNWAKKIIEAIDARPYFVEPTLIKFLSDLDRLIQIQDEPFGTTSIFAQYMIFNRIAETNVKVILNGQGADEQLAGYHGYFEQFLTSLLIQKKYLHFGNEYFHIKKTYSNNLNFPYKTILKQWTKTLFRKLSFFHSDLLSPNINSAHIDDIAERLKILSMPIGCFEDTLTALTCETNLPQLLRYDDRNSMGHSIESRVPFLDKEIVNFCLSLPSTLKIHNGLTKAVLRNALKDIIPNDVRMRIDKLGFPSPEIQWLKKGFNINVHSNGSREWRELITSKWLRQLENFDSLPTLLQPKTQPRIQPSNFNYV